MSYLPARNRPLPSSLSSVVRYRARMAPRSARAIIDRDPNRSRPATLSGACCASCGRGGPCVSDETGFKSYRMPIPYTMGDTVTDASAQLVPMVASIQESAQQYVKNDLLYRKLQIAATLAIPLAAMITKGIFHWRSGRPLF